MVTKHVCDICENEIDERDDAGKKFVLQIGKDDDSAKWTGTARIEIITKDANDLCLGCLVEAMNGVVARREEESENAKKDEDATRQATGTLSSPATVSGQKRSR